MRRMPWVVYAWPGLPLFYEDGSWAGLAIAVIAVIGLNVLLLASFGWTELISAGVRSTVWAGLGVTWMAVFVWQKRYTSKGPLGAACPEEDGFTEAISSYLEGDYYQAEQVLDGLLERNPRDLEARLMRATLMRRTGRLDEARRELDSLVRFDGAEHWELEIRQQLQLLRGAAKQSAVHEKAGGKATLTIGHAA